jgi:hypothetical protein
VKPEDFNPVTVIMHGCCAIGVSLSMAVLACSKLSGGSFRYCVKCEPTGVRGRDIYVCVKLAILFATFIYLLIERYFFLLSSHPLKHDICVVPFSHKFISSLYFSRCNPTPTLAVLFGYSSPYS